VIGRIVITSVVLVLAYGAGWIANAALNDDPCIEHGRETDRTDYVERWFPVRTDCRITTRSGATRIREGSSEAFWVGFALTLFVALALMSAVALAIRVLAILAAGTVAFLLIFIV
jgi:hypothetical protein